MPLLLTTARTFRTREAFDAIEKPDYSPLLNPSFWLKGEVEDTPAMAESKKKM